MVKRPSVNLAFDCTTFVWMSYGNELRQSILPILNYLCHATDMEAVGTIPTFFMTLSLAEIRTMVTKGIEKKLSPRTSRN